MKNLFTPPTLMVLASAVLWGTYGSMGLLILAKDRSLLRIKKEDLPLFLANGLLSHFFFFYCYTAAIRITKVATAAVLLYTAPAIVMVLSVVLSG